MDYKELSEQIELKTGGLDVSPHIADHYSDSNKFEQVCNWRHRIWSTFLANTSDRTFHKAQLPIKFLLKSIDFVFMDQLFHMLELLILARFQCPVTVKKSKNNSRQSLLQWKCWFEKCFFLDSLIWVFNDLNLQLIIISCVISETRVKMCLSPFTFQGTICLFLNL